MVNSRNRRGKGGGARSPSKVTGLGAGFSLASFVAGIGVGAIAAVTALYALEGEEPDAPAAGSSVATVSTTPVSYEFWERLPSERLGQVPPRRTAAAEPAADAGGDAAAPEPTDGDAAAAKPAESKPDAAQLAAGVAPAAPEQTTAPAASTAVAAAPVRTEYLLQVGAFREAGAADKRRAELLLAGMEAQTTSIGVEDGVLYRVIVGPFPSMRETRRAMGELQERRIAPILLERAARPG